ncbi:MAG: hypothetical protein IIC79_00285 [Chloroflexi bacterium]|nr:hypothetical protein [Chloroflexota bacterium]
MADYKAVSLNVMHESTAITDRVYSQLKDDEVGARIESLGQNKVVNGDSIAREIEEFLHWREQKRRDQR